MCSEIWVIGINIITGAEKVLSNPAAGMKLGEASPKLSVRLHSSDVFGEVRRKRRQNKERKRKVIAMRKLECKEETVKKRNGRRK